MHDRATKDAAESLCKACGLCCNGVWFATGTLKASEEERAVQEGFQLQKSDAGSRFTQPCSKYQNSCCSAYTQWRPEVCATFSCRLLDQLRQGEISGAEAMKHVKAARAMADRVISETAQIEGGLAGQPFLRWLSDEPLVSDPPRPQLSPGSKMDAVALRVYFERHFKQPGKQTPSGQEPGAYLIHDQP